MAKVTPLQIKNAQPKDKPYKIYDEQGLFMIVNPNGSKWWRLKYRFQEKEKTISLGVYPKISLKEARVKRNQHRLIIESKHDPSEVRKEKKLKERSDHSFAHLALLWHKKKATNWTTKYSDSVLTRIKINLLPYIGKTDINDLTPKIMLEVLRKIELRGAIETAHRIRSIASQIFKFAIAMDICISDPTRDIGAALAVSPTKHYPSLTNPKDICILLHKIDKYPGSFTTRCALQLAALFFVRPGELAQAKWSEFDLNLKQWHIPAERMKMKSKHIVPLSKQAIDIIQSLSTYTDHSPYLFPHTKSWKQPMNRETLRCGLRRIGYKSGEMTTHGFRSMASTRLHELGWPSDIIERQLAHVERNKVKGAYNYAEHLEKRTEMMQFWADYLDQLKICRF